MSEEPIAGGVAGIDRDAEQAEQAAESEADRLEREARQAEAAAEALDPEEDR